MTFGKLSTIFTDDSFVQKFTISFLVLKSKILDGDLYRTCEHRNATEKIYFKIMTIVLEKIISVCRKSNNAYIVMSYIEVGFNL